MGKWDKLNQQFNEVLESLTDEDWKNWEKNRTQNKELRKSALLSKAQDQEIKISASVNICLPKEQDYCKYYFDDHIQKVLAEIEKKDLEKTRGRFFLVTSQYERPH